MFIDMSGHQHQRLRGATAPSTTRSPTLESDYRHMPPSPSPARWPERFSGSSFSSRSKWQRHKYHRSLPSHSSHFSSSRDAPVKQRIATPPLLFGSKSLRHTRSQGQTGEKLAGQTGDRLGEGNPSHSSAGVLWPTSPRRKVSNLQLRSAVDLELETTRQDSSYRFQPSRSAIDSWRQRSSEAFAMNETTVDGVRKAIRGADETLSNKASVGELGRVSVVLEEGANGDALDDSGSSEYHEAIAATPTESRPHSTRRRPAHGSTSSQSSVFREEFTLATPSSHRLPISPHGSASTSPSPIRLRSGTFGSTFYDPFPAPGSLVASPAPSPEVSRPPSRMIVRTPSSSRAPSIASPRRALATLKKLRQKGSLAALAAEKEQGLSKSEHSELSFACAGLGHSTDGGASFDRDRERFPSIEVQAVADATEELGSPTSRNLSVETHSQAPRSPSKKRWWRSSSMPQAGLERGTSTSSRRPSLSVTRTCHQASLPLPPVVIEHRLPTPERLSPLSSLDLDDVPSQSAAPHLASLKKPMEGRNSDVSELDLQELPRETDSIRRTRSLTSLEELARLNNMLVESEADIYDDVIQWVGHQDDHTLRVDGAVSPATIVSRDFDASPTSTTALVPLRCTTSINALTTSPTSSRSPVLLAAPAEAPRGQSRTPGALGLSFPSPTSSNGSSSLSPRSGAFSWPAEVGGHRGSTAHSPLKPCDAEADGDRVVALKAGER